MAAAGRRRERCVLELRIVAFGIDHAELEAALGQALENTRDQGRFAAARDPCHQQATSVRPKKELIALLGRADRDPVSRRGVNDIGQIALEQVLDQLPDAVPLAPLVTRSALALTLSSAFATATE